MKTALFFLGTSAAFLALVSPDLAFAVAMPATAPVDAAPVVNIPWGGWVQGVAQTVMPYFVSVASTAIMLGVAKVAPWASLFLSRSRVEQAVQGVADYGINATNGAMKGQVLEVNVGSVVFKNAIDYAIKHVPDVVVSKAGGWESFASMVFRSLNLGPNSNAGDVLAPVLTNLRLKGLIK